MPSNVLPRPGRGTHHRQSPTESRRQGGGKGSAQGAGRASGEIPAPSAIHEACRDAEGGKARGADDPGLACQPLFGERPFMTSRSAIRPNRRNRLRSPLFTSKQMSKPTSTSQATPLISCAAYGSITSSIASTKTEMATAIAATRRDWGPTAYRATTDGQDPPWARCQPHPA